MSQKGSRTFSHPAPGWPGIAPRWTTSAKSAVGTALTDGARVWFTASHGILNEIYYPELDCAVIRDAGFIVSANGGFFSQEKRHADHVVEWLHPGVPAFRFHNRCQQGRYEIRKRICCSPEYDVVLQHVHFVPLAGTLADYHLTLIVASHLGNQGAENNGWLGDYKSHPMLFAERDGLGMAVASTAPWRIRSAAYAGRDDAFQDVYANGQMTLSFDSAMNGNVALAGEVDLVACGGEFTIALAFGPNADTAALHARATLTESYAATEKRYVTPWRSFQQCLHDLAEPTQGHEPQLYRGSVAIIKSHASMNVDGGLIASLSIPWGNTKGDGDLGGYHLVWPRDMVSSAGGLLAAGAMSDVRSVVRYLAATQEADGHWAQNMWINGMPYWTGVQLDETAFPILLMDIARRNGVLDSHDVERWWSMVDRAAHFIVSNGPATGQDRWEENGGYSPFTLAVTISALLVAAEMADVRGHEAKAHFLRDTADAWNELIEHWTWAEDTPLARRLGVKGYYVRIGSADPADIAAPTNSPLTIKNRHDGDAMGFASDVVATDALALVRFGLRSAADPRMRDTVTVIDALLKTETVTGPVWHRYNGDGYGEHEDGSAFDGTGIGRGWPLLAGERGHYELALGNRAEAERLAGVMRAQAGDGGLLPEQTWDTDDIPELGLLNGRPAGSAMPLAWAHAEYVKLLRSLYDGQLFDCPPQGVVRYVAERNTPRVATWRIAMPMPFIRAGRTLRIELGAEARVHWSIDGWQSAHDTMAIDSQYGVHVAELPTHDLPAGAEAVFTFQWTESGAWEGKDYRVSIVSA